jgi:periplasmic protein TonB
MAFSDHNLTLPADISPTFQPRYRVVSWGCSFCFHAVALAVAAVLLRELPKAPTPVYRMEILLSDPQAETDQVTPFDPQGEDDPATPPETTALTEDSSPVVPPSPSIRSASSEMVEQHALSEPSIVQRRVQHVTPVPQAQQATGLSSPASDPAPIGSPMPLERQIETVAPVNESYRPASVFPSETTERSGMTPAAQVAARPATEAIANVAPTSAIVPLSPHDGDSSSSPPTDPAPVIDSQTGSSGSPTASPAETVAMNHPAITRTIPTKSQYGWLTELLRRRIMSLQAYPRMARMEGWEGIVVVRTIINSDGSLVEAVVTKSSGYGALDEDALKLMHRVCPIHLPQDLGKSQIAVLIPIRYRLNRLE